MRKRIQMSPNLPLEGRHSGHSWTKAAQHRVMQKHGLQVTLCNLFTYLVKAKVCKDSLRYIMLLEVAGT